MNAITVYPRPDISEIDTSPIVYEHYDENGVIGYDVKYVPKTGIILVSEDFLYECLPEFKPDNRHLRFGDYLFEMRWRVLGGDYLFELVKA